MAGLYVHIPFCGQRCAYCDFYKSTDATRTEAFLAALGREMELQRDRFGVGGGADMDGGTVGSASMYGGAGGGTGTGGVSGAGSGSSTLPRLDTIYVGGGTPSVLSPRQLQGTIDRAAELWDCTALREVTVEANPEDLTDDYLASLADTRFNRLSMGVQSLDDDLLRLMNRRHSARRALDAINAAQRAGFDNITIDLIYGIPGMTHAQWDETLERMAGLGVQHVSAYHLTIEPGTAFARRGMTPIPEAESERQYELLRRKLADAGMEHYEISNFALPGRRAIHNSAYWSGERYWGVGPSAHSFDGRRRREWVTSDLGKYIAAIGDEGTDPAAALYDGETLTDADVRNERVMTALRTVEGIAESELLWGVAGASECGEPGRSGKCGEGDRSGGRGGMAGVDRARRVEKLLADGLLERRGGRVAIPPARFLLSDYVIASLFE